MMNQRLQIEAPHGRPIGGATSADAGAGERQTHPASSRRTTASMTRMPARAGVEARDVGELLAAVARGTPAGSPCPAPPASPGSRPRSPARPWRGASRRTWRGAPPYRWCRAAATGSLPNWDWIGHVPARLGPAQPLAHEPRGLLAVAGVGVALLGVLLRHAVEGHDERVGLEVELGEMVAHGGGDGVDVGRARRNRAGATRTLGCQRSAISARNAWSQAVAVVAAAYCG